MTGLRKMMLAVCALFLLLLVPFGALTVQASGSPGSQVAGSGLKKGPVFILPVDQEIERGLESLKRGFEEAGNTALR